MIIFEYGITYPNFFAYVNNCFTVNKAVCGRYKVRKNFVCGDFDFNAHENLKIWERLVKNLN